MRTHGFSLVELSIVLVILGLLTGGILAGQNLIRAAELRAVSTEYNKWISAANTFRDKYFQLPGDFTRAHEFWASAGGSGVIGDGCETASGSTTQTCSGDGNGRLSQATGSGQYAEIFTFWQHLSLAGMIDGSYTGKNGASTFNYDTVLGQNAPRSKINNAGWGITIDFDGAPSTHYFPNLYDSPMSIGGDAPDEYVRQPIFLPEEAWNIDTKMDDGRPGTGFLNTTRSTSPLGTGCATTDVPATAEYSLSNSAVACQLIFNTGL
ncbi:MAG: hypothetical protein CMM94_06015 [Rickettsiales bacterium]|nr:hypothetical protein [Rickettsiales bacterium]|tara:strand:+ start:51 stop:845 length:795 start_codon:yes stop_codon:yes gene_type:complete